MYFIRRQAKQTKMIFHYSYKRRESYRTNMFCIVPAFSFTFYRSTSFKNASAFLLRDARHAKHDIFLLRISAILPEAISDVGLTPTTDTNLLLAT